MIVTCFEPILVQRLVPKRHNKSYRCSENNGTFHVFPASAEQPLRNLLELLTGACRMAAIAFQCGLTLGRLTIRGTVLLARGHRTKTTIHGALVRICRHSPSSSVPNRVRTLLSDAHAQTRDAGPLRYRLLSSR